MRKSDMRLLVPLLAALVVLAIAGCDNTAAPSSGGPAEPAAGGSAASSPAIVATSQPPVGVDVGGELEPMEQTGPKLGPTNAPKSWAYLKDMYEEDGWWYVVVDYIQVTGPEENLQFLNTNPKLRTFPLKKPAKLLLLKSPGSPDYKNVSPSQFKTFQSQAGDEMVEVTPSGGYAKQLKEWWAP